VSLDSEEDWRRLRVPRVHLIYRFVNSIIVLLSQEPVMFDIVYQLNEEHTKNSVTELVLQRCPSEEEEDGTTDRGVNDKVCYHLVVQKN
tara:strand:+ start:543 stop:809 length:267 start_codon:yes stop_codon:yes gene_type:complete